MSFKITFNKPAGRQFIQGEESGGLRIKIQDGTVMFMPVPNDNLPDTAKLIPRTRGGFETFIDGSEADAVLETLHNEAGPFFIIKRVSKDWVAAEPYSGKDAPPKFEPHIRVWTPKSKSTDAKQAKTKVKKATSVTVNETAQQPSAFEQIIDINWAYQKLSEPPHPGRPDKETIKARAIRDSFENTDPQIIIEAYNTLGSHLRKICPSAVIEFRDQAPTAARGYRPIKSKTAEPLIRSADDLESENQIQEALEKLGLSDTTSHTPSSRKRRASFSEATA
jgi:hypothetical protein